MHGVVSIILHMHVLRTPVLLVVGLPSIIGGFIAGGWKVGLLNIPLGLVLGAIALRLAYILHTREKR